MRKFQYLVTVDLDDEVLSKEYEEARSEGELVEKYQSMTDPKEYIVEFSKDITEAISETLVSEFDINTIGNSKLSVIYAGEVK